MPDPLPVAEPDLVRHVIATTGLAPATATRVIADVVAYFDETVDEYVRRRHHELRLRQLKNAQMWSAIAGEISIRRFGAPVMTERQLRRIVYG
jgi:siroheme synthase (precorrin-2 oxidase/ferrochelatase)